jgi:hypothetical protein
MEVYVDLEQRIEEMEEKHRIDPILLHSEGIQLLIITGTRKRKQKHDDLLNKIGRTKMIELSDFKEKQIISFSQNIVVLEDLILAIKYLTRIRGMAAEIACKMALNDEVYTFLSKYNMFFQQENLEQYKGSNNNWKRFLDLEQQQQVKLQKISPNFKNQIAEGIELFLLEFQE